MAAERVAPLSALLSEPAAGYALLVISIGSAMLLLLHDRLSPGRRTERRAAALLQRTPRLAPVAPQDAPDRHAARPGRRTRTVTRLQRVIRPSFNETTPRSARVAGVLAAFLSALGVLVLTRSAVAAGIIAAIAGPMAFFAERRRHNSKRERLIVREFPATVDTIVRGLRSGLTLTDTFKLVEDEADAAIAAEFRRIETDLELGLPLGEAARRFAERVPRDEIKFFVTILTVQNTTGGALADTLATLSETLRKRRGLQDQVRTLTADARSSAVIIGSLPIGVAIVLYVTSPSYLAPLLQTTAGLALTTASVLYMLLGVFIMARMIRFDA